MPARAKVCIDKTSSAHQFFKELDSSNHLWMRMRRTRRLTSRPSLAKLSLRRRSHLQRQSSGQEIPRKNNQKGSPSNATLNSLLKRACSAKSSRPSDKKGADQLCNPKSSRKDQASLPIRQSRQQLNEAACLPARRTQDRCQRSNLQRQPDLLRKMRIGMLLYLAVAPLRLSVCRLRLLVVVASPCSPPSAPLCDPSNHSPSLNLNRSKSPNQNQSQSLKLSRRNPTIRCIKCLNK